MPVSNYGRFSNLVLTSLLLAVFSFCPVIACATMECYISPRGSNATGDGSMENPWASMQFAIDKAIATSTGTLYMRVAKGEYHEDVLVAMDDNLSAAYVYGGYDDSQMPWTRDPSKYKTIVFGSGGSQSGIIITKSMLIIDGFEVHDGNIRGAYGGVSSLTNNVVYNGNIGRAENVIGNRVYEGGVYGTLCENNIAISTLGRGGAGGDIIRNNIIVGGDMETIKIQPGDLLENNFICGGNGSTVEVVGDGPVTIRNNVIAGAGRFCGIRGDTINGVIEGNVITRHSGGIGFNYGNPEIRNNVIAGCGSGIISGSGWPRIRNCIFWDNADDLAGEPWDIKYSLTGEGYPGEGNISADPKLVGWGEFTLENPIYVNVNYAGEEEDGTAAHPYKAIWKALAAYDFHLSADSPCIGTGEGGVDMGAYPGAASYSTLYSPSARIDVLPGTYYEANVHPGNRVWLRGVEGAAATVIRGAGDGYLTPWIFALTDRVIVDGFTVDGDFYESDAIQCQFGSYYEEALWPVVMNCTLKDFDRGIMGRYGSANVVSCLFLSEQTWRKGIGIHFEERGVVANSVFYNLNLGMSMFGPEIPQDLDRYRVRNCILWANAQDAGENYLRYCDIGSGATDPTNFSENPLFTTGPSGAYFHLPWYSPCRNRGTEELAPVFDPDGRLRGQGKVVDVGLYEYEEGWVWSFPGGATQDWESAGAPMTLSEPEFPWRDGGLLMRATSNTDCFGFWLNSMGEIAYVEDSVYELRWDTKRTVSGLDRYPVMRLRTNTDNLEESTTYVINDSGELTSGTQTGVYTLYLVRPEQFLEYPGQGYRKLSDAERLLLSFDMLNFDPAGDPAAEILLDNIEVTHSRFRKDWQAQEFTSYDFESGEEGWTPSGEIEPFTAPEDSWTSGMLALQSTTNTNCFGFWQSGVIELPTTATQTLLRATFTVKSDEDAGASSLPIPRLRIIREDSSEVVVKTIEGKGTRTPGTELREYTVCYWLAAGSEPHRLRLAFDLLNFNPEASATATLFLDNVKLETLSRR